MGLIDLFKKKQNNLKNINNRNIGGFSKTNNTESQEIHNRIDKTETHELKRASYPKVGYPSKTGLYVNEEIMLRLSPKFYVGQTDYPAYLTYDYKISFPTDIIKKLEKEEYIRRENPSEALKHFNIAELKVIAQKLGIAVKGKKNDICSQIVENAPDHSFDRYIKKQFWIVTEKGKSEQLQNKYLDYIFEHHRYSLGEVGVDAVQLNKMVHDYPNKRYRDIIWGNLNKKIIDGSVQNYGNLSQLRRTMAYFVEEEKKYASALDLCLCSIYYQINHHAFYSASIQYESNKQLNETIESTYRNDGALAPFQINDLNRMIGENQFDIEQFRNFMNESFSRIDDKGPISDEDFAEFIVNEMSNNTSVSSNFFKSILRKYLRNPNNSANNSL